MEIDLSLNRSLEELIASYWEAWEWLMLKYSDTENGKVCHLNLCGCAWFYANLFTLKPSFDKKRNNRDEGCKENEECLCYAPFCANHCLIESDAVDAKEESVDHSWGANCLSITEHSF